MVWFWIQDENIHWFISQYIQMNKAFLPIAAKVFYVDDIFLTRAFYWNIWRRNDSQN